MHSSFLKPNDYRFDMGLRRGSVDYFRNSGPATLLEERRALLQTSAGRYAAALPGSEAIVQEAAEFAGFYSACSLEELGSTWEPDFVLLDDVLRVQAGCVCFPSSWSLPEKLGKPITEVHAPVPGLNDEMAAKIQTFLHMLKPGEVWERWNWGLAASPQLNDHPTLQRPRLDESATLDTTWFRVEHQGLVRLPQTGAVLFGIRIMVSTLRDEMAASLEFAPALKQQLQTMPPTVAEYKSLARCREALTGQL